MNETKPTIFVIDDDPVYRKLSASILKDLIKKV